MPPDDSCDDFGDKLPIKRYAGEAAAAWAFKALLAVEWHLEDSLGGYCCPFCRRYGDIKSNTWEHEPDCLRQRALREAGYFDE